MLTPLALLLLAIACTAPGRQSPAATATAAATAGDPAAKPRVAVRVVRSGQNIELDEKDIDTLADDEALQKSISVIVDGAMRSAQLGQGNIAFADADAPVEMEKDAAFFGVSTEPVAPATAAQLPLPRGTGLAITTVEADSPAAKAGLAPFDVLARIGDQMLVNPEQFAVLVRSHKAGESIEVTYLRGGKEQKATVALVGKELPKLGPGGRRVFAMAFPGAGVPGGAVVTGAAIAGAAAPNTVIVQDVDGNGNAMFMAPGAPLPGNGQKPHVVKMRRVAGAPLPAQGAGSVRSEVRQTSSMSFTDDHCSIDWTENDGTTRVTIKDKAGKVLWSEARAPTAADLAALPADVRAAAERFIGEKDRMRDAVPNGAVPPMPPIAPAMPVGGGPAVDADGG